MPESHATEVDFWFDPLCPWTWITSRWMSDVAQRRNLNVAWHIASLAILHTTGQADDESAARHPSAIDGLDYGRVVTAVKELQGAQYVKPLYNALGERIHVEGMKDPAEIIPAALEAAGLPAEFARYATSDEFDGQLWESHFDGIDRVGKDVGLPIIAMNGAAIFGPVVSPAPTGDAALRIWDAVVTLTSHDGFFELKRTRTRRAIFD